MLPLQLYCIVYAVLLLCNGTQLSHLYCCMGANYMYLAQQQSSYACHCVQSKGKYIGSPILYYSNSVSTHRVRLLICGDINPNPGPSGDLSSASTTSDNVRHQYTSEFLHSCNSMKCSEKWREENTNV